ncbi:MAG: bifunctional 4-hydroxy-2-oxoglutarate aldolase/2-dehydro-3-deoxy-phosphogluconate aldolase [Clostridia bacterium]|nr:bifunctional 4-hydroxy-2-oxoglutarate aldolase/2-dehydro-3-deoxy-phosphogluconate aldolase [Clostridia bacterium]
MASLKERQALVSLVKEKKIVAILRGVKEEHVENLTEALLNGGISILEVTLNTPGALKMIKLLQEKYSGELAVGAGTVLTIQGVQDVIGAGGQFIVTPNFNSELVRFCDGNHIPVFPGAFTASEVVAAHEAGADIVKVFPAMPMGPGYIKALKGPLDHISLMPTGGVGLDNIGEFLKAGACSFGIGGELVNKKLIEEGNWVELTALAREYTSILK